MNLPICEGELCEPHRQEILVKCSDEKGGGGDLENLGESLGEADGLDELDGADGLDESDGGRQVGWRECCFEKFRLLMMIGFVFKDCKSTVELFYKK